MAASAFQFTGKRLYIVCNGKQHTVKIRLVGNDAKVETPDCPSNTAAKLAAFAALGHQVDDKGCAGFRALVEYGLPQIVEHNDFRGWRALFIRYEQHQIVKAEDQRLRDLKYRQHADFIANMRAVCRPPKDALITIDEVDEPRVGDVISCSRYDAKWTFPVQKHWKESVRDLGIPVVDGKLIVGVATAKPGIVYAIERNHLHHFVVAEYALDWATKKMAKVAA